MIALYQKIAERILQQCPSIKTVKKFNNQVEGWKELKEYDVAMPCVLVQIIFPSESSDIGNGVQIYDPVDIKVHIVSQFLNGSDMELNEEIYDFEAEVHSALYLFQIQGTDYGSGAFTRISREEDDDHDNLYHHAVTYRTTWIDNSQAAPKYGSDIDPPLDLDLTVTILPQIE